MKSENKISKRLRENRQWPNFKLQVRDVESPKGKSMTIQDDSYTVQEILEKFSVGELSGVVREPLFQEGASHDSVDLRQVMTSDLIDRMELLEDVKERQRELSRKQKQAQEDFEADEKQRQEEKHQQEIKDEQLRLARVGKANAGVTKTDENKPVK